MEKTSDEYIDSELNKKENEFKTIIENDKEKKDNPRKGFLENPKALRNARSVVLGLIVLLLPLIYFLAKDSITLDALLSWEMGGLMIVTTIGTIVNISETRKSTFEDVVDANSEISNDEIIITEQGQQLSDRTLEAIPILNTYNEKLQNMYDLQKTAKKISKLKRNIGLLSISLNTAKVRTFSKFTKLLVFPNLINKMLINSRTRKIKRKTAKIERLNLAPLRDNKFKPYRIERLLTSRSGNRYTQIGDRKIQSAPDKVDLRKSIISLPLKGFGMSLTGGVFALFLGVDLKTLLLFYLSYILGQLFTVISQHLLTKYKTTHEFREAQIEKKRLQTMLLTELKKSKEEKKEEKENGSN